MLVLQFLLYTGFFCNFLVFAYNLQHLHQSHAPYGPIVFLHIIFQLPTLRTICYKEVLQYQVMCLSEVYHLPGNTKVTQRQMVYFLEEDLYLVFATWCFPIHVCEGFVCFIREFCCASSYCEVLTTFESFLPASSLVFLNFHSI
jgi:hypothetical protein